MAENLAYAKSFDFAVDVVKVAERLRGERHYELASQLIRAATSIGANLAEAKYAQSNADYISKYSIALKEASETRYWLKLLEACGYLSEAQVSSHIQAIDEILKILTASIKTLKHKSAKQSSQPTPINY